MGTTSSLNGSATLAVEVALPYAMRTGIRRTVATASTYKLSARPLEKRAPARRIATLYTETSVFTKLLTQGSVGGIRPVKAFGTERMSSQI
jgi:hypothetical protein